jgi:hypothetical protein
MTKNRKSIGYASSPKRETMRRQSLLEGGDTPFDYEDYMKRASVESFEVV